MACRGRASCPRSGRCARRAARSSPTLPCCGIRRWRGAGAEVRGGARGKPSRQRSRSQPGVFLLFTTVRRAALTILLVAAMSAPAAASAASLTPTQASYRSLADHGVKTANRLWYNKRLRWWNDRLNSHKRFPLATIWSIVPLFETANALALADRSHSHVALVRKLA